MKFLNEAYVAHCKGFAIRESAHPSGSFSDEGCIHFPHAKSVQIVLDRRTVTHPEDSLRLSAHAAGDDDLTTIEDRVRVHEQLRSDKFAA